MATFGGVAGSKALVLSGSVLVSIVILRVFDAATLGNFSIAMAAAMLLALLFRGGLDQIALHTAVKHKDRGTRDLFAAFARQQFTHWPAYAGFAASAVIAVALLLWQQGWVAALLLVTLIPAILLMALAQLFSVFSKIEGRPIRAALVDMGLIQISIVLAILLFVFVFDYRNLAGILTVLGALQLMMLMALLFQIVRSESGIQPVEIRFSDRAAVIGNSLLMLSVRNGYPLIFMFFVATADIGSFRLEERLAFTLTLVFAIIETALMRPLVQTMQQDETSAAVLWRNYFKLAALVAVPTTAMAAALFAMTKQQWLMPMLGLSPVGELTGLLFFGAPFLSLVSLSCLFLNLLGKYGSIRMTWLASAVVLFGLSPFAYAAFGIDGLRAAYVLAAVAGALAGMLLLGSAIRARTDGTLATEVEL